MQKGWEGDFPPSHEARGNVSFFCVILSDQRESKNPFFRDLRFLLLRCTACSSAQDDMRFKNLVPLTTVFENNRSYEPSGREPDRRRWRVKGRRSVCSGRQEASLLRQAMLLPGTANGHRAVTISTAPCTHCQRRLAAYSSR